MGDQRKLWLRQQLDQHALPHVVRARVLRSSPYLLPVHRSHASIAPAVRKARNLPEDLIRLCVGIEDPDDLIDDLEAALLEAGAVRVVDDDDGEGLSGLDDDDGEDGLIGLGLSGALFVPAPG